MHFLPLIRPATPGIYRALGSAHTDTVLTVPDGARGLVIWFEQSASDPTLISGRIGVDQANTPVTGLTGTDALLGYHPPMPVEYRLNPSRFDYETKQGTVDDRYIHLACGVAGAVVRGMWLMAPLSS